MKYEQMKKKLAGLRDQYLMPTLFGVGIGVGISCLISVSGYIEDNREEAEKQRIIKAYEQTVPSNTSSLENNLSFLGYYGPTKSFENMTLKDICDARESALISRGEN